MTQPDKNTKAISFSMESLQLNEHVNHFIQKVLDQIYTETDGVAIRDEMLDHIYSLTEDYLRAGHSQEVAINKALLQMGDPAEIGYSFTDYEGMKKRKMLRVGLKCLAGAIIIGLFLLMIHLSGGFAEVFKSSPDDASSDSSGGFLSFFYMFYFPILFYFNIKSQGLYGLSGIPMNRLKITKEPLLILWPYKKRFPWEYTLLGVFFLPIILVFIILFASEGNNPLYAVGFILAICISIWLVIHSEKYRIPKYMILEEGIVIKNNLITWASIDKISWTRDYLSKDDGHHRLILEHVFRVDPKTSAHSRSGFTHKRNIDVNANQYKQINAIIKERI